MKTLAVLLTLIASTSFAGTIATPKPGDWVLRKQNDPTNTVIARYTTYDECEKAAPVGKYKCDTSVALDVIADCVDVKAPKVYLTQVTIGTDKFWQIPSDGFDVVSETVYVEMAPLFVHNAAWPAGAPACWVPGRAPRSEWRFNAKDEPGKAFMEHIEPGMIAEDQHPDGPPEAIVAGCCWNDAYQSVWLLSASYRTSKSTVDDGP